MISRLVEAKMLPLPSNAAMKSRFRRGRAAAFSTSLPARHYKGHRRTLTTTRVELPSVFEPKRLIEFV